MNNFYKKIFVTLTSLLSLNLLSSCNSLNGKNGVNGKDASVEIDDDGYIYIDGVKTDYYFENKDCSVKVNVENNKYGSVSGDGNYSCGSSVILTATAKNNGVFVCWKDKDGNIIEKDNNLLIVVDNGINEYNAVFACLPEYVNANINVKFDETTLKNTKYIGDTNVKLTDGATLKFADYGEKSLTLYKLNKEQFELDSLTINSKISNNEINSSTKISYEQYISLYDKNTNYYTDTTEFYYYVVGKENNKYTISYSTTNENGSIVDVNNTKLINDQELLGGTVVKLKAVVNKENINGTTFDTCSFSYWLINGQKYSSDETLSYSIWSNTHITAVFTAKVKLNLLIRSGESGLTSAKYKDLENPQKAHGTINGINFETSLNSSQETNTISLGYFNPKEPIELTLKLNAYLKTPIAKQENTWKFISQSFYYNNNKIGGGYSLSFFVPPATNDQVTLRVDYVRTLNYLSEAKNESGESAKEGLYETPYGILG